MELDIQKDSIELKAMTTWRVNIKDPVVEVKSKATYKRASHDIVLCTVVRDRGMSFQQAKSTHQVNARTDQVKK